MTPPLCPYCQRINLDNPNGYYSLGKRSRLVESRHECPFCDLVWHASKFELNDDDSHVGITWTPDGFVPGKISENNFTEFGDPMIVPIDDRQTVSSPEGVGRHIKSKVSSTTLKTWLNLCESSSSPTRHQDCKPRDVWRRGDAGSSRDGLKELWLVDVHTYRIHKFRSTDSSRLKHPYVVLSYVIGDHKLLPKYNLIDLEDFKTGGLDTEKLPQTYWDAMEVVRMLDLKYLWVDALCLPSGELGKDEKRKYDEGIANFDRIYEGAELTIIAADGEDADSGIRAINRDEDTSGKRWHYRRNIASGEKWELIRGVYDRLKDRPYVTRGWTYQEIVLSHRCLIFVDGLAFFRCRTRLYSEDTFWDGHDGRRPSPGIMTTPYEIEFLPLHISDPWLTYAQTLQSYRAREYWWEQTIDAYRGILNRITDKLDTSQLVGMPKGMLDMALLWYHRPDINLGKHPRRVAGWPSWSWAGWWKSVVSTFTPFGDVNDRRRWIDRHTGHIEFWSTHTDGTELRQIETGAPLRGTPPTPYFEPGSRGRFLQFQTWMTMNADVRFGRWGIGQIRTPSGVLAGMVYADDLHDYGPNGNVLVALAKAPDGDPNFDYGLYFPGRQGWAQDGDDEDSLLTRSPISAKNNSIQWVLLIGPDGQGFQQRRGLGYIHTDKFDGFDWGPRKSTVALV